MGWFNGKTRAEDALEKGIEHGLTNSRDRLDHISYRANDAAAYRRGLRAGDRARERDIVNAVRRKRRR